ncbi:MAG: transcriptional repressor [Candidatus Omnitrophica bacterium]|nr:transcriptional repressor [Candidatus Omnitrophota bacterium]
MKIELYLQQLKEQGFKITPKRKAIIELFSKKKSYLSPQEVLEKLTNNFPGISVSTVYRILEELQDAGILVKIGHEDRQLYYSLCRMPDQHHHHFICRKCRRVEEVDLCNFKEFERFISKNLDCKVENHSVQIGGLCSRCK